ncbi:MAG: iron-sulfur cluster assembly scaffold protein [Candidatus Micrarchaeota archaeon]|nr:iron-sulfur cluster assembly scaffold protein [Candidatus Micrarchaeota archaeon]
MALDYEELIEAYRHPRHKGKIRGALHSSFSNISCGDSITLYLSVGRDGTVEDAKYEGNGCVISMAAAEALCSHAVGRKLSALCRLDYGSLTQLLGFTPSAGRIGCVMVVLTSLRGICEKRIKNRCNK